VSTAPLRLDALDGVLGALGAVAVAVSGGVDSMTLAAAAHRRLGDAAQMVHATSPAVPPEATARVRRYARERGWPLVVVDAGEFADPSYLANPADRCYFCKRDLYGAIAPHTTATIVSGTNLDDLGDIRPGLRAATERAVRHPFVDAGIDKAGVRAIARALRLDDVAELPGAPCLSSRIETGIAIRPEALAAVHAVERDLAGWLVPETVRCRLRADGVVVELDDDTLASLSTDRRAEVEARVAATWETAGFAERVRIERYRRGSAFLHVSVAP
jgi:pyridinium-3,5-biscarboxylic acid mononucleotide sulfurtransferase